MKTYTVYTYCQSGETRLSRISAYTLWFNPAWTGCVVYDIKAKSGKDAKKSAVRKRASQEAMWLGSR